MSWTEVFPVLTDEMVDHYLEVKSLNDSDLFVQEFEVSKIINQKSEADHLVATSLFWKKDLMRQGDMPEVSRELMVNARMLKISGRFDPWEKYVLPIIECAEILAKSRPQTVFRIYLANDLHFLVDEFVAVGCEVYLMVSSSIRHNPGALWRFLAMENCECPVTIIDADMGSFILPSIARTEAAREVGLGGWRIPYVTTYGDGERYRPMHATQFGCNQSYPMRSLLEAFVWYNINKNFQTSCVLLGWRECEIAGAIWPDYGFDEWFLMAVIYPRISMDGLLTFVPWDWESLGQFFALDIEYCTWANSNSQLIYYPDPEPALGDVIRPWAEWRNEEMVKVRSQTSVVQRHRRRTGAFHGIFSHTQRKGIERFGKHTGDLLSFMESVNADVDEQWLVDLNPQLYLSAHGGELFLDHRYDASDVVFCGYCFIKITPDISEWAIHKELDVKVWAEGRLLKVPKLEGPMTLWRTEFSRRFYQELIGQVPFVKAEILLRAWMDQGRVCTAETTAKQMGWAVR